MSLQSEVEAASAFLLAETLFASGCLQPALRVQLDTDPQPANISGSLSMILDEEGSDKGSRHGYASIYEEWALARSSPVTVVVEIGLGSPSALTPSNMGPEARPGASVVAFSKYFAGAAVIGADIDSQAFPSGVQGAFFVADQLRPLSFGPMISQLADVHGFDFGVVDGLHTPEADINSALVLLPWLRPLGLLSVEDIGTDPVVVRAWHRLIEALPEPYSGRVHKCHVSHLVTITRG